MNFFSIVAFYLIVWWMVFYITLPFGSRQVVDIADEPDGVEPGAPKDHQLIMKMIITSVISAIIVFLFVYFEVFKFLRADNLF